MIHLTRNHLTNQDDEILSLSKGCLPKVTDSIQESRSPPVVPSDDQQRPVIAPPGAGCMDTSQKERLLPSREYQSRKIFRVPTTYTTGIRTFLMRWNRASNYSKHGVAGCIFFFSAPDVCTLFELDERSSKATKVKVSKLMDH